ncbi:MAG TPA: HlyD family efflux transporter periplasmic adaptor subunit [Pyrinomonadaceae bacterium]|nr:HlyD family efflux transporter periplasmic adaptor subunit [Pyrinomonadaceae bacterium]
MPRAKLSRVLAILTILILVAGGVFLLWWFLIRQPPVPHSIIVLSGRIEGDDSTVAAKTSGRIREIRVREGDIVKAGEVIALLDEVQAAAREDQARSASQEAQTRVTRSQDQIAVLREQLKQADVTVDQAKEDAEGRVRQAEAQVSTAEANLAQAQAAAEQARYDLERFTKLAKSGDVPDRQREQARTAADSQAAVVEAMKKQVAAARAGVTTARANLKNVPIRSAQAATIQKQIDQAQSDVAAAQADAERSRSQVKEAEANRTDLTVVAPFDGTIATRVAEPGEVVAPGAAIVTMIDLDKIYLRGFVPEGDIGRVKLNQAARIYLDSNPRAPIDALVSRIDPEASFTPENTYFRDERVKQVVGVKLLIKNPNGSAKPGMPADGEILVEGSTWPRDTGRR